MTRKKSGFFTFCFSLIPGAGEMYMGFFKQGISLMMLFSAITVITGYLNMDYLMMFQPVIWFYSFFHVHNLKALPDDEFYALEDDFLFHFDRFFETDQPLWKKYKKLIAAILIFFGFSILWNTASDLLISVLRILGIDSFHVLNQVQNAVPQIIIAIGIIVTGIYMIKGKKQELMKETKPPKDEIL